MSDEYQDTFASAMMAEAVAWSDFAESIRALLRSAGYGPNGAKGREPLSEDSVYFGAYHALKAAETEAMAVSGRLLGLSGGKHEL